MKALMITGYGALGDNLEIQDVPEPVVGEKDILIEVHAAGINPIDYKIVKGHLKALGRLQFPAPIGFDLAGIVSEVGSAVSGFQPGDEVYARVSSARPGTIGERIAVDAGFAAKKPKKLSFAEAASLPLVGLTSIQSLARGGVAAGSRVLIHAGSGGIGAFAIQYAKHLGAYVYTTTSTPNVEWVGALGADRVIDYKTEDYREIARDLDMVYDTLGGAYTLDAFDQIKPGGKVVSIAGEVDEETARQLGLNGLIRFILRLKARKITGAAHKKNAEYKMLLMHPDGAQLEEIGGLVQAGKLKAVVDQTFDFDRSIEALEYLAAGRAKGKVVIQVKK